MYQPAHSSEYSTPQIHKRLTLDYELDISLRTVQHMCNDILVVKSHQIDENTKKILSNQSEIIIAADGQDPEEGYPAIWAFTDVLSNWLLKTTIVDSMHASKLQKEILDILKDYDVSLAGFISDKQNNLVKCM